MARHWFGGGLADWAFQRVDGVDGEDNLAQLVGGATITFWNAETGGTQHTDLLVEEAPATSVVSSDGLDGREIGTIPPFQGPDGVWYMWADGGAGTRSVILSWDIGDHIDVDLAELADLLKNEGIAGQYLTKDPDPDSETGVIWGSPPGGGGSGGSMWVDVTTGPYLADKTGVADSRSAIQAAIDDVSNSGGGVVYLPRGTYAIGYTANAGATGAAGGLQLKSNVWLRGENPPAARLQPTGTWSTEAGLVGIGDTVTTRPVRDARVSHLWLKGTAGTSHVEPVANITGVLFNTDGIATEPDANHRIHDLLIWDCDRGLVLRGDDDQGIMVQRVRGRWFRRQGVQVGRSDGSGGAPDNYFVGVDVSSANRLTGGTAAGIEVHASNTYWTNCNSWFNKRSTAFVEAGTYSDGAGWYLAGVRSAFSQCAAQDNGGHGFVVRFGKHTMAACLADSNNHIDNISGSAVAHECSGFYLGSGVGDLQLTGALSFDRHSIAANRYQKHGYVIDAAARSIELKGAAWDNRSTGASADPLDGVAWVNGSAHGTHLVRVLSAYGSSRATISSGETPGAAGTVHKRQVGNTTPVTGTTLTDVANLSADVPGGSRWYRIEALLKYRADATQNARIALKTARDGASGSVDLDWQAHFVQPAGTAGVEYSKASIGSTRYIVADGDGNVAGGAEYANQRSVLITGILFAGTVVNTATVTVQVAEDGGAGDGVKVIGDSYLTVAPFAFS